MQDFVEPRFELHIYGNWSDIIRPREYRDALIDQKPFYDNAEDASADYQRYSIPFTTVVELSKAFQVFDAMKIECHVAVKVKSAKGVEVFAATGTGYGSKESFCEITVDESMVNARLTQAIATAKKALEKL